MLMTEAQSKKRLLILGSGFSKAVSDKMPVVRELATALKEQIKQDPKLKELEDPKYQDLLNDPELLLTYLAQDQPWKKPDETHEDRALFLRVSRWLAKHLEQCEHQTFEGKIPEWTKLLAKWLNEKRTWVVTFNYDTVLERICFLCLKDESGKNRPDLIFNSYRVPLAPIQFRRAGVFGGSEEYMFDLVKLHGSINWFYSGWEQFPGEQIYCRLVDSKSPYKDYVSEDSDRGVSQKELEELEMLLSDKVPLIIPPVAEKSRFYANQTVRYLWGKAREYLKEAEEIYVIGYSLPDTDLTTKLLLQAACAGQTKTVYIVNNDMTGKNNLLRRYRDAFPQGTSIKDDYICPDAVEAMVKALCGEEAPC